MYLNQTWRTSTLDYPQLLDQQLTQLLLLTTTRGAAIRTALETSGRGNSVHYPGSRIRHKEVARFRDRLHCCAIKEYKGVPLLLYIDYKFIEAKLKDSLVERSTDGDLVIFLYRVHFCCRFVIRPFILCCVELCSRVLLESLFTTYEPLTDEYIDDCIVPQKYQRVIFVCEHGYSVV